VICGWEGNHRSGVIPVKLRPNSITPSSSRTSWRAVLQPASELDSVMEFGLSSAILLASRSATSSRAVADRFELSRHVEIARTWQTGLHRSATRSRAGLRPAIELLVSWIAPDRRNSITLSSWLAGRRPAREPPRELVRELNSVGLMEFGLYASQTA